jgi:hypothetical protein
MQYHEVRITGSNRTATVGLAVAALTLGAVFLALGLTLLLGIAIVGTVAAAGVMLYRRLTGRGVYPIAGGSGATNAHGLDPSMEVFPATGTNRGAEARHLRSPGTD